MKPLASSASRGDWAVRRLWVSVRLQEKDGRAGFVALVAFGWSCLGAAFCVVFCFLDCVFLDFKGVLLALLAL